MDTRYLQTFRTIVDTGSFSAAAKALSTAQSTITFQVGQLEQELSVKLFEKVGRKMVLTKAGEDLIPYVDETLSSWEKLVNYHSELENYRGELHIGVAETQLCYRLAPVLQEFHRRAPEAQLFLESLNCYVTRDRLINGSLDLGVFYRDVGGVDESIITNPLGTFTVGLFASPEVAEQYPDFITSDQTIPLPFIINEPNCIFRQIFEQYTQEKKIRLDHTIELMSIPTIKSLVMSQVGVTFLPHFAVQEELKSGQLVEISTDLAKGTSITAVCGRNRNRWASPLMDLFTELVTEA